MATGHHPCMTPGFTVAALVALLCAAASPKVPNAGAAAPTTASPEEAQAAEVMAALSAAPVARPALSSKAELGQIVGYAASHLSTPMILSLQRQRVGSARFVVRRMHRNDPISGDAIFYNDDSGSSVGSAYVSFDAIAGQTYVVECVGSLANWTFVRYRQDGPARYEEQRVTFEGTVRPSLSFTATQTETALIGLSPQVPIGDERALSRCQIVRVDAVPSGGAAKPVK